MSAYSNLPEAAGEIAGGQGWDDESIVIHLAGFISSQGLDDELTQYLDKVAAEENADFVDENEFPMADTE